MRLAAALVTVAGCAATLPKQPKLDAAADAAAPAAPPAALAHKTHGVPGEIMEYQVDLRGITVGRVMVAVGQPGWIEGRHAIIVRSRGTSAGVLSAITELRWELTSTLDLDTGELIHEVGESWVKFNGKEEHDSFDREGDGELNVHAAAGALRAWRSRVGERAKADVTIEHKTFSVEVRDEARELIGARPAVRYAGIAHEKYAFTIWISDDASRVPLRLHTDSKVGAIDIELIQYDVDAP